MNYELRIKKQKERGFTLVETLVAISIFSISILGILSILASSINDTIYAKDKMIAGYLAQEGIEYVRNVRDNYVLYPSVGTWATFVAKMTPCTSGSKCGFSSTSPTNSTSFIACSSDSINCQLYLNNGVYNDSPSGVVSGFTRKVWMKTTSNLDEIQIFSEVDWNQGSGTYNITLSEDLFNWEQ